MKMHTVIRNLVLTMAVIAAATLLHAQNATKGYELSHSVAFTTGDTYLSGGDSITIDSVHGTSDGVTSGNLYEVKGHYKLVSHDTAELAANITGRDKTHSSYTGLKVQNTQITRGAGEFTLYLYMFYDGWPHVSFYPTSGGQSFAGVYFGTGDSVMKPHTHRGADAAGQSAGSAEK